MKRKLTFAIMISIIVVAFGGGYALSQQVSANNNPKQVITVQDSADRYVEVPYPVERVVVLWDNPTEEMKALGAVNRIVGIDTATKADVDSGLYPDLTNTPVIGSWDEPNYEAIAELDPDVVIMLSSYAPYPDEVQEQLSSFDIAVVGLDFYRTEVFFREITTLGFMLGLENEAADYIAFFQDTLDMISSRLSDVTDNQKKTVYFEAAADYTSYGGADYGAGIPGMIRQGGGIDLYPEISPYTFEVDPEDIVQRNPDVIIKGQPSGYFLTDTTQFKQVYDSLISRPELASTTAVTSNNVYVMSFDIAGGARKVFGPMFLAKMVYPELFTDFNPELVLQEYLETYLGLPWQGMYVYP